MEIGDIIGYIDFSLLGLIFIGAISYGIKKMGFRPFFSMAIIELNKELRILFRSALNDIKKNGLDFLHTQLRDFLKAIVCGMVSFGVFLFGLSIEVASLIWMPDFLTKLYERGIDGYVAFLMGWAYLGIPFSIMMFLWYLAFTFYTNFSLLPFGGNDEKA